MAYLIKVTIIWAILLALFELLYKNNAKFTANRIYLLLSIVTGLLLPVLPLPSGPLPDIGNISSLPALSESSRQVAGITTPQVFSAAVTPTTNVTAHGWDPMLIIGILYCAGVLFLFFKYLFELFKTVKLLRKSPIQLLHGHKIVNTGKVHSPYSFLSYTFLTDAACLRPDELGYIIRHEAAHNKRKHWLDLWILQLLNIIFWFHPLIWRYRYLLRLQHEYEADAVAANDDPYTYGRFILQQTLLRDVPSITHSFHFSPIKNRIQMLTKINNLKPGNRKYMLLLPTLLACTFLMAKSNTKAEEELQGNKMYFKGNVLTWRQSDTLFYDKEKGQAERVPSSAKVKPQVITGINNEPVYRNDYLQMQASYGGSNTAFGDYVKEEFQKLRKNTADSLTYLADLSLVVDKTGKVVYYSAHYAKPYNDKNALQSTLYPFFDSDTQANALIDKIIADSPLWKPALNDGNTVNSYVTVRFPGC